jgi:hypothetical protein
MQSTTAITSGTGLPFGSGPGKRHDGPPKKRLLTLEDLDRRTKAAQRALELHEQLVAERGGPESLSVLRHEMTRSVAVLTAMIEDMQARWLRGDKIDPAAIATLLNARRREAELIGLDPQPRDVTPSLQSYLREQTPPSAPQTAVDSVSSSTDPVS